MSSNATTAAQLRAAKQRLANLEKQAQRERTAKLLALPRQWGFKSMAEFIRALREAAPQTAPAPKAKKEVKEVQPYTPRGLARSAAETSDVPSSATPPTPAPASPDPSASPAASQPQNVPATASAAPAVENAAPPPPPLPTGTSLDDPANFGLMPDLSVLDGSGQDPVAQRERLTKSLEFARKVLHTSRVPAAVWREWRNFERSAADALKAVAI